MDGTSKKLGEGTFGIVYSCFSPKSNRNYAFKRNLAEKTTSFISSIREVDILVKIKGFPFVIELDKVSFKNSPSCCSPLAGDFRNTQKNDKLHFIFAKATRDLHSNIYDVRSNSYRLNKLYIVQILLAIEYLHSNKIVHLDIKPGNILIFSDRKTKIAKLCDFGLSKPYSCQEDYKTGLVTSWYRSPELTLHNPKYDYKVDVWSMGCVIFEIFNRYPFISDIEDDDDIILSHILHSLQNTVTLKDRVELITNNPWRKVNLLQIARKKQKLSIKNRIGLTKKQNIRFKKEAGNFNELCDLINNMLTFKYTDRPTITQCLDHKFFNDSVSLIKETRNISSWYKIQDNPEINIKSCIERKWMLSLSASIFEIKDKLYWYTNRILFLAMDLFDRYLSTMFFNINSSNKIESDKKGILHDKFNTNLRFLSCLYISIKYFITTEVPPSFEYVASIVNEEYISSKSLLIAEKFEENLILHCLDYNIYRPTVIDVADHSLSENEVIRMFNIYQHADVYNPVTPVKLYEIFKKSNKS
jgi:serine/threonine protein kinase